MFSYFQDQPGITDELDLTLVSADYSGSSNNSQIFSPSTDESLGSSRYTNELAESAKNDAFVGINVKPSTFTVQPPDSKDPSMISRVKLLNYSSVNQSFTPFSLSSFSSSRSSCSVNSKTPTLSLTDSFGSCFMNGSLKGGLRHHFTGNTDKNSIDRRLMNVAVKNSRREGDNTSSSMDFSNMVSSSLSSGFTPQSTADDKTSESLLSFVWNERLCTEDSSSSGKSTSNCRLCTSNEEQRTHSNVESFISAGQREISVCSPSDSLSESLISFLRHERSAADGSEHLSESSAYLKE